MFPRHIATGRKQERKPKTVRPGTSIAASSLHSRKSIGGTTMKTQFAILTGIVLLALAGAAYAHHPFAAEYDWTKPVTFTGTVSKLDWMNPHASLEIDAKDDSGQMKHWTLELGSLSALTRAGWTKNTL